MHKSLSNQAAFCWSTQRIWAINLNLLQHWTGKSFALKINYRLHG